MTARTLAPGAGPAIGRRPVPWSKLAWVTLRQRRGLLIGGGILLGVFAVYMVIMAVLQDNAYAAVAAEFSPGEVAALLSLIVTINAWNAIGVTARCWLPGSYEP